MPKKAKRPRRKTNDTQATLRTLAALQGRRDQREEEMLNALHMIAKGITSINDTLPALLHSRQWKEIVTHRAIQLPETEGNGGET